MLTFTTFKKDLNEGEIRKIKKMSVTGMVE